MATVFGGKAGRSERRDDGWNERWKMTESPQVHRSSGLIALVAFFLFLVHREQVYQGLSLL